MQCRFGLMPTPVLAKSRSCCIASRNAARSLPTANFAVMKARSAVILTASGFGVGFGVGFGSAGFGSTGLGMIGFGCGGVGLGKGVLSGVGFGFRPPAPPEPTPPPTGSVVFLPPPEILPSPNLRGVLSDSWADFSFMPLLPPLLLTALEPVPGSAFPKFGFGDSGLDDEGHVGAGARFISDPRGVDA